MCAMDAMPYCVNKYNKRVYDCPSNSVYFQKAVILGVPSVHWFDQVVDSIYKEQNNIVIISVDRHSIRSE